ncbi:MAG TPA: hypothetical protein VK694_03165 [Verrucomicrobiae bacterium]|nr:hypothetical protein [Verrucomicrobiae bacterium]
MDTLIPRDRSSSPAQDLSFPFRVDDDGLHLDRTEAQLVYDDLTDSRINGNDALLGHLHTDLQGALEADELPDALSLSREHIVGLKIYYGEIANQMDRAEHRGVRVYGRYVTILSGLIPLPSPDEVS